MLKVDFQRDPNRLGPLAPFGKAGFDIEIGNIGFRNDRVFISQTHNVFHCETQATAVPAFAESG